MVSRADGSDVEQMFEVTKHSHSIIGNQAYLGAAGLPCWSPDGKSIAFFAAMEGDCRVQGSGELMGTYGLFVVDVATKHRRRLTSGHDSPALSMIWLGSGNP